MNKLGNRTTRTCLIELTATNKAAMVQLFRSLLSAQVHFKVTVPKPLLTTYFSAPVAEIKGLI